MERACRGWHSCAVIGAVKRRVESNQDSLRAPLKTEGRDGEPPLLRGLTVTGAGYVAKAAGYLQRPTQGVPEALFLYCLKGAGWCELAGRLHTVRRGDVLVIPTGTAHACGARAAKPWTVHWVRATGTLLPDYLDALAVSARKPVFPAGESLDLLRLFDEIEQARQRGAAFEDRLLAAHALAHLLARLIERRREQAPENPDNLRKVADAIIYMSEHVAEPLRVSALARLSNLSPDYFTQLFKAQTGCAPRDYLHLLRMHRACQLLRESNLAIKEIATRLGYQDPFHFSRQFKAFEGVAPTDYRELRH